MPGQVNLEGRAFPWFAVDVDEAVVLLDDAVDRGQPQAGSLPHLLGGEKRFEDLVEGFLVHAAAVVAYGQQHILPGDKPRVIGAVGLVEGGVFRFDGDLADSGDGVPGVDAQIGQDLVDLGGVHLDRPQVRARQPGEIDVLADQPPQHLEHALHGLVQVEHLGGDGLLAGKGQQLPGQVGGALGGLPDFLEVGMKRLGRVHLVQGQFRIAEDHAQHVVEIMGHAARQPADRLPSSGPGGTGTPGRVSR